MHIYIKPPTLQKCSKCGKPVLAHTACFNCGHYKGKQVIDVMKKLDKKEKKKKEKEIEAKEKEEGSSEEKAGSWEDLSKK